ncbi:hypothetical protein [Chitinophaga lutea]|nr:hypothetical protein [Chitinophaga lutea]
MMDWFGPLPVFEKVYWCIAIFFSLLFLVQNTLSLFGGALDDATGDVMDMPDEVAGFRFFTLRNLFGFFTVAGWAGLASISSRFAPWLTLLLSVIAGLLMMLMMAALFYYTGKMAYSSLVKTDDTPQTTADSPQQRPGSSVSPTAPADGDN